jgi:hypothetical protein
MHDTASHYTHTRMSAHRAPWQRMKRVKCIQQSRVEHAHPPSLTLQCSAHSVAVTSRRGSSRSVCCAKALDTSIGADDEESTPAGVERVDSARTRKESACSALAICGAGSAVACDSRVGRQSDAVAPQRGGIWTHAARVSCGCTDACIHSDRVRVCVAPTHLSELVDCRRRGGGEDRRRCASGGQHTEHHRGEGWKGDGVEKCTCTHKAWRKGANAYTHANDSMTRSQRQQRCRE